MTERMNREELMDWAASLPLGFESNPEGSPDEALLSGWINAMDMAEDSGWVMSDEEFVRVAYSEFDNMGYNYD